MPSRQTTELIDRFDEFYRNYYRDEIGELAQQYPSESKSLYVSLNDLYRFDHDLADDFIARPEEMRQYAEEALRLYDLPVDVKLGHANIRVHGLRERVRLADVRSDHIGHLIEIYGTIKTVETTRSGLRNAAWECQRCGVLTRVPVSGRGRETPHMCEGCEREGPFLLNSDQSEYKDFQRLVIEQRDPSSITESDTESIVAYARDDLAGEVEAGQHVVATGTLKREDPGESNDGSLMDKYLELTAIMEGKAYGHLSISEDDKKQMVELSNRPDVYEQFIESLAPSVVGYEEVKLGLLLQLFSGVQKTLPDGTTIRGGPHVLLLGDPSTAKSRLLAYASRLAPRSVEVSGESSDVGLTASLSRSGGDGNPWEVSGGALVLADRGLLTIDNFHTLRAETQQTVSNVIEEQVVKVSKATITEHLRARTAVLAAAQPKFGRFDQYQPFGEQVDMEPGVVSQFDLIHTIIDAPDPERDPEIAEGILAANHAGEVTAQRENEAALTVDDEEYAAATEPVTPPISPDLVRKYIAYARENCYPKMSAEAKDYFRDFYVNLRSTGQEDDAPVPVTARKLEGLVRLGEASARLRLSDVVEVEDAERVVSLVKEVLRDVGVEPVTGEFDAEIVEVNDSELPEDPTEKIHSIVRELEGEYEDGAPEETVFDRAETNGMERGRTEHALEKLRRQGKVYEPMQGHLRTT